MEKSDSKLRLTQFLAYIPILGAKKEKHCEIWITLLSIVTKCLGQAPLTMSYSIYCRVLQSSFVGKLTKG